MPNDPSFESLHHAVKDVHSLEPPNPLFESIVASVNEPCFIASSGGEQFHFLNHAAFETLGYTHDELIRMSVKAVITPASLERLCNHIKNTAASEEPVSGIIPSAPFVVELIKKDRTRMNGTVRCFLQMTNDGEINMIGGAVHMHELSDTDSAIENEGGASETIVVSDEIKESETTVKKTNNLPGKILIMDDENILIDIATQMGKRIGLIVECSRYGDEAIDMYRTALEQGYPYDAVLLDMTIAGGMGGIETSEKLHEIDENAVTIVMSGYSDHEVMSKPHEYGFSAVISKPFRLNDFNDILHEVIPEEKFKTR